MICILIKTTIYIYNIDSFDNSEQIIVRKTFQMSTLCFHGFLWMVGAWMACFHVWKAHLALPSIYIVIKFIRFLPLNSKEVLCHLKSCKWVRVENKFLNNFLIFWYCSVGYQWHLFIFECSYQKKINMICMIYDLCC